MTTQPTLAQLAKWREDAEDAYVDDGNTHFSNDPKVFILGYLRAKHENEQATKDARKQALEDSAAICNATCDPNNTDHGNGYNSAALDCEKKIKELLK